MGLVTDKVDPRNVFDLRCMPRRGSRADMIQDIYTSGFKGAFLRSEISPNGAPNKNTDWDGDIARWGQADFRYNTPGRKKLTSDVIDDLPVQPEDTDGCHVYTMHAFEEWEKTGEGNEGPFQIYQDYGNCVDASWIEMMCSILAIQAADPARREQFKWLAAFCLYHTRGYCSDGWWGHAIAAAALRYGWCPWMLINVNGHQLDFRDEDTAERWASREACRNPSNWEWLHNWMAANFGWEDGGITELDIGGDIAALKKLHANKAHLHHGSNYTSGSAIMPGQIIRISGHQQTDYGGDWSDRTLAFFRDKGVTIFSENNYPCPQGNTWGPKSRGEILTSLWPPWWGPKHEGAWICTASQQLRYFGEAMVYIPGYVQGVPAETPPPPPSEVKYRIEDPGRWIVRDNPNGTTERLQKVHTVPWPKV